MSKKSKIITGIIIAVLALLFAGGYLYYTGALKSFFPKKAFTLDEYQTGEMTDVEPEEYVPDLILVNKEYTIDAAYDSGIVFYRNTDVLMNSRIVNAYGEMSDYVKENLEDKLYVSSTYRSYEDQGRVLEEEGEEIAALPGQSEHQTGLAVDVYVMYHAGMAFIQSPVGKYLNEHCQDFGFIIRYPEGRKEVTGFDYEPWHLRYVGHPHAEIIMDNDITLEEYLGSMIPGKWYSYGDYVIGLCREDDIKVPSEIADKDLLYSRDNRGNVVVWGKIR